MELEQAKKIVERLEEAFRELEKIKALLIEIGIEVDKQLK